MTHQGPARVQGAEKGSPSLDILLDAEIASVWFHGHETPEKATTSGGPNGLTKIVPLGDVTFQGKSPNADDPYLEGFSRTCFHKDIMIDRSPPLFWREFRRNKWHQLPNGQLVCPHLL